MKRSSCFKATHFAEPGNLTNKTREFDTSISLTRTVELFEEPACSNYSFTGAFCNCALNEGLSPSRLAKKITITPSMWEMVTG